jgi:hypothetical protein
MNIELEEVVVMDVSDDALELAAGDAQGGRPTANLRPLNLGWGVRHAGGPFGRGVVFELDEVVVQDVSDDALELAAGGAQGGRTHLTCRGVMALC